MSRWLVVNSLSTVFTLERPTWQVKEKSGSQNREWRATESQGHKNMACTFVSSLFITGRFGCRFSFCLVCYSSRIMVVRQCIQGCIEHKQRQDPGHQTNDDCGRSTSRERERDVVDQPETAVRRAAGHLLNCFMVVHSMMEIFSASLCW